MKTGALDRTPAKSSFPNDEAAAIAARLHFEVKGVVQGVGFRPYVYRLACAYDLSGWICNRRAGVSLEVEGVSRNLDAFLEALGSAPPPISIHSIETHRIPPAGDQGFAIRCSELSGVVDMALTPDMATCDACLRELEDPQDPRSGHPFINCSQCGPRFTIVRSFPYDRERTSMASFQMCERCSKEFASPADRRHHAQPIACPECGPCLQWYGEESHGSNDEIIGIAARMLRNGDILAVKGVGGFHLLADPTSADAVTRLRELKRREGKAFALMYPNMERLREDTQIDELEERAIRSSAAPIVLLRQRGVMPFTPNVAPENPYIGAILAYTPLHHLILREFGGPVVATSANCEDEPIVIDDREVHERFGEAVDGIILHDRAIVRRADDSVVRQIDGKACPLRIGRGLAPCTLEIPSAYARRSGDDILAMGGYEKAAIAFARGEAIHLSQHLGDLETTASRRSYTRAVQDWLELYEIRPSLIVCDAHPDYFSSQTARELAGKFDCAILPLQHHVAHLYSALLDQGDGVSVHDGTLAVCWDGTGFGNDGTIWGGEWLMLDRTRPSGFRRVGSLLPFELPGGARGVREPWRVALSLGRAAGVDLHRLEMIPDRSNRAPASSAVQNVARLLDRNVFPITTSAGRLFDGVASLLGLRHYAQYSAQPACELEYLAEGASDAPELPPAEIYLAEERWILDWRPWVRGIGDLAAAGVAPASLARAFHEQLACSCVSMIERFQVCEFMLTGGCFQNRLLTESIATRARARNVEVHTHKKIPPNDGGVAAGQALAGVAHLAAPNKG